MIDFDDLRKQGKTVIYKETESVEEDKEWELWGERETPEEKVFVYRKIVTFEEAERYELESELLT